MKNKKILLFLITLIILNACAGAKDALQGKKRSDNSDEFLVEKKNPLTTPPDYEELPVPISDQKANLENKKKEDIKNLLKESKTNSGSNNKKNINLEESIIEKISN